MNKIKSIFQQITVVFWSNKKYLRDIFTKYFLLFPLQIVLILLNGFSQSFYSISTRNFLDDILNGINASKSFRHICYLIIYILLLNVCMQATKTYSAHAFSKTNVGVKKEISGLILNLRSDFFDVPENINILNRAIKYRENSGSQLINYFFGLLTELVAIISLISLLSPFAWWIVFFLIGLATYRTWIETIISKRNFDFNKKKTLLNRMIGYYGSLITNHNKLIELAIYNGVEFICKKYEREQDNAIVSNKSHNIILAMFSLLSSFATVAQYIVLYFYIGHKLFNNEINVADFTLFFTAVGQFNGMLSSFRKTINGFVPMALEAKNYIDFIDTSNNYAFLRSRDAKVDIHAIQSIEFKNVSFKYPQKNDYILKNISFTIKQGDTIALVGMNGSGKSTIIKLLLGIYIPLDGEILINSIPLKDINIFSLWQRYSVMFQSGDIFSLTAYENITFDESCTHNLDGVLSSIDLLDRLKKEKEGIHTPLTRQFYSEGTELSGGEKQKIVLARLLHKDSDLMILDEPSSALDANAEKRLFKCVFDIHKSNPKRIMVFITHKLSYASSADKILFIKGGQLLGFDSHNFLYEHCREYNELYSL